MTVKRSPCVSPVVVLLLLGETGRGWLVGSGSGIVSDLAALFVRHRERTEPQGVGKPF